MRTYFMITFNKSAHLTHIPYTNVKKHTQGYPAHVKKLFTYSQDGSLMCKSFRMCMRKLHGVVSTFFVFQAASITFHKVYNV